MLEHIEDRSQKLLADMTDCDIEMLPLGTFLCQIVLKGFVPHCNETSCLEHGPSEVCGTAFDHC